MWKDCYFRLDFCVAYWLERGWAKYSPRRTGVWTITRREKFSQHLKDQSIYYWRARLRWQRDINSTEWTIPSTRSYYNSFNIQHYITRLLLIWAFGSSSFSRKSHKNVKKSSQITTPHLSLAGLSSQLAKHSAKQAELMKSFWLDSLVIVLNVYSQKYHRRESNVIGEKF